MNTVLVPIYWEQIEKVEGVFDYTVLDGIIQQARKYQKRLVLLWFGLWKNSESMYVPGWIKKDSDTYFRAKKISGELLNTISPLSQAAVQKDATALAHVLGHIREVDQIENTVIAIQVENEIGLLGTDRDYSALAEKEFAQNVPAEIEKAFSVQGAWKECFGYEAGEYFMAFHLLPLKRSRKRLRKNMLSLLCQCLLKQYPWFSGSYPSGDRSPPCIRYGNDSAIPVLPGADIYVP
jgi:beta-galactosidase GanA